MDADLCKTQLEQKSVEPFSSQPSLNIVNDEKLKKIVSTVH